MFGTLYSLISLCLYRVHESPLSSVLTNLFLFFLSSNKFVSFHKLLKIFSFYYCCDFCGEARRDFTAWFFHWLKSIWSLIKSCGLYLFLCWNVESHNYNIDYKQTEETVLFFLYAYAFEMEIKKLITIVGAVMSFIVALGFIVFSTWFKESSTAVKVLTFILCYTYFISTCLAYRFWPGILNLPSLVKFATIHHICSDCVAHGCRDCKPIQTPLFYI